MSGIRGRKIGSLPLIFGLVAAMGACLLAPASALALEHPFIETFGATAGSEPFFTEAQGLAVDQAAGDLLVIDGEANTISRWNPDGMPAEFSVLGTNVINGSETPQGEFRFGSAGEVQIAVDNSGGAADGDIYIAQVTGSIDIFASTGEFLGQLTGSIEGSFVEPCGVAVDPSGNVYVGDFSGHIHKYEPSGNPPINADNSANFPFASNCSLAAGAGPTDGFIFPNHFNANFVPDKSLAKLDSSSGEEKYVVDPGPVTTETVDPATGLLYAATGNQVKEYDASGPTEAVAGTPIAAGGEEVTGVAVNGSTGNIYVARKGNPHIEVWGPAALLPEATTEPASVIGGTVTLHGVVGANGGAPCTCVFEYVNVSVAAEGFKGAKSAPCSPAGPFSGTAPNSVSAEVSGLAEGAYRFRVVARNEEEFSKAGEARLFETFESVPGLPDGRAYELVSPALKAGEVVPPEPTTDLGGSCGDCLPGQNSPIMPMQSTSNGEAVLYGGQPFFGGLASQPSDYVATRSGAGWGTVGLSSSAMTGDYLAFSPDLSRGVLFQESPALSPQAPTRGGHAFANLYLQEGGVRQPLLSEEPPNREPGDFRIHFAAANEGSGVEAGFGHILFEANDALTGVVLGIAPAAPEVTASGFCSEAGVNCDLYEWEAGQLRLLNVLPGNLAAAEHSVIGAGRLLNEEQSPDVSHAISADGRRVFWTSEETGQLYVRIDGEETLEVPGPGSCKDSVPVEARVCFLTASADGSQVLLSDGQLYQLNGAGDAYEPTVDLTEGEEGFRGILGASEDLSRVYFIDTKALSGPNAEGKSPNEGGSEENNLYAYDEGALSFIATLVPGDNKFGTGSRFGTWSASPANRTAQASADGRFVAFMSLAPLTGYDNRLRGGGECKNGHGVACREVFEYATESETLSCASCNPGGERPLGGSNLTLIVPTGGEGAPFPQPGNLSRDGQGRLFFESLDALSPRDTNGRIQDVYEWEPDGIGSCKRAAGCVYLISSGHNQNDSMFMDSSANGDNVFFITRAQLLPVDENSQLDLYDARVRGGFPPAPGSPCAGEGCAGPLGTPPALPGAGSGEFSGPGNPPPPKPKPKKHKKKKHHHHHKRAATHNRGGHR